MRCNTPGKRTVSSGSNRRLFSANVTSGNADRNIPSSTRMRTRGRCPNTIGPRGAPCCSFFCNAGTIATPAQNRNVGKTRSGERAAVPLGVAQRRVLITRPPRAGVVDEDHRRDREPAQRHRVQASGRSGLGAARFRPLAERSAHAAVVGQQQGAGRRRIDLVLQHDDRRLDLAVAPLRARVRPCSESQPVACDTMRTLRPDQLLVRSPGGRPSGCRRPC
jgi:hypothetical protein